MSRNTTSPAGGLKRVRSVTMYGREAEKPMHELLGMLLIAVTCVLLLPGIGAFGSAP